MRGLILLLYVSAVVATESPNSTEDCSTPVWARRALREAELSVKVNEPMFPLVLSNEGAAGVKPTTSLKVLLDDLVRHRTTLRADLASHGALLLRGFPIYEPNDFESVLLALGLSLADQYKPADARRTLLTNYTFTAADTAGYHFIPPHHEQAYSTFRPGVISFFCHTPPEQGGETPIFRTSNTLDELSPAFAARLRNTRVEHQRVYANQQDGASGKLNFRERLMRGMIDLLVKWLGLPLPPRTHHPPWQDVFQTAERSEAEAFAASLHLNLTFDEKTSAAHYRASVPSVVSHPVTGDERLVWQVPQWSYASLRISHGLLDRDVPGRLSRIPFSWRACLANCVVRVLNLNYQISYANGECIEPGLAETLVELATRHGTYFHWLRGDVLVIDNVNAMHARMPCTDPHRRILTAISDFYLVPSANS